MSDRPRRSVSVVVPSYARPTDLARCITALAAQSRRPDEVLIVLRQGDTSSTAVVKEIGAPWMRAIYIDIPGVVAAIRMGVAMSTGDIVAFTDDDAEPYPCWIAKIEKAFEDPRTGGVGGRDVLSDTDSVRPTGRVGRHSIYGKVFGNHHRGRDGGRVEVLKGVNMAFRAEALAIPVEGALRGDGAQVHYEVAVCAWARSRGWVLRYEPSLRVRHHMAMRHDDDQREDPSRVAIRNEAFNWLRTSAYSGRMTVQAGYGLLVGGRGTPGIARWLLAAALHDRRTARRIGPSLGGQIAALRQIAARGSSLEPLMSSCFALRSNPDAVGSA